MIENNEAEYENCLLQSVINELNSSKDTLSSSSSPECGEDSEKNQLSIHKKKQYLVKGLSSNLGTNGIFSLITSLKNNFTRLIMGKQTNYYISDLIKKSTKKQKLLILSEIYDDIKNLSINDYGTHPIQTFIVRASSKEEICLITNSISNQYTFLKLSTELT